MSENTLIKFGEYEGVIILIKKGSSLEEQPINYSSVTNSLKYGIMSAVNSALQITGGLVKQLARKFKIIDIKRDNKSQLLREGEVLNYSLEQDYLKQLYFLLLDVAPGQVEEREKKILKETIMKALNKMEEDGLTSAVIPGISCRHNRFPIKTAADMHFEAIEEFIEVTKPKNLKLITICLFQQDEIDGFIQSSDLKFKKYSCSGYSSSR